MRSPRRVTAGAAALLLACGLSSCHRAPATVRLVRLAAGAGKVEPQRLPPRSPFARRTKAPQATSPGLAFAPGETRTFDVDLPRGSRLVLSFGIGPPAPKEGFLVLRLLVNGRERLSRRSEVRQNRHWQTEVVPLDALGRTRLEVRGDHLDARGQPLGAPEGAPAWIRLAVPRLYVPASPPTRRRVLVWLSQDALRADHLGTYGYATPTSPRFDELARQAVVFDRAITAAPWTLPSLTSQFTSTWPAEHGAVLRDRARAPGLPTVFEALAGDGFTVLGVVASGFVSSEYGLTDGFDTLAYAADDADKLNRIALRLIDETPGGDVALFLHYCDTHHVYDPPPPYDTLFEPGYRGSLDMRDFANRRDLSPADVKHVRARYDGAIRFADEQIGELLKALRQRALLDTAVVVYTADHGEQLQDHGGWFHATVHEEVLHVPLVISAPGLPARRVAGPVSTLDLAPTVLDLLRVPAPATFVGKSLQSLMRGGAGQASEIFSDNEYTHRRATRQLAIHEGRWKEVLLVAQDGAWPPHVREERFFDLAAHPREETQAPRGSESARLRERLLAYLRRARDQAQQARRIELAPEVREGLELLGYVDR